MSGFKLGNQKAGNEANAASTQHADQSQNNFSKSVKQAATAFTPYKLAKNSVKTNKAKSKSPMQKNFDKVLDNISFSGFDNKEIKKIKDTLHTLYFGSKTARKTLDKVGNHSFYQSDLKFKKIEKFEGAHASIYKFSANKVNINTKQTLSFINQSGDRKTEGLTRILMHEIIHAVDDLKDNYSNTYEGDTVHRTNKVLAELGHKDMRVSYDGAGNGIGIRDHFTNGHRIDNAIVSEKADMRGKKSSDDLMIGLGNAVLHGGKGNDYIYGAEKDILSGGAGNDVIMGGDKNDKIDGGPGIDTAVYSGKKSAYTIKRNAKGQPIKVIDNRYYHDDGNDTLHSIEKLKFLNRL